MRAVGNRVILQRIAVVVTSALFLPLSLSQARRTEEGASTALTAVSDGGTTTVAVKQGSVTLTCVDNTGKKKPFEFKPNVTDPYYLALTPDGKRVAVAGLREIAVIRLIPKARIQATWEVKSGIRALAHSSDGKWIATAGLKQKKVVLFDATSGEIAKTWNHDEKIGSLRFSTDGKALAAGTKDGKCLQWSCESGKLLWEARLSKWEITSLAFFPCGKKIAVGSENGTLALIDARTGKTLASYIGARWAVGKIAVSQDGKYVASLGTEGSINVWDAENEKNFATEKFEGADEPDLAFSKTHLFIAVGTGLRLFDLKTKKLSVFREAK